MNDLGRELSRLRQLQELGSISPEQFEQERQKLFAGSQPEERQAITETSPSPRMADASHVNRSYRREGMFFILACLLAGLALAIVTIGPVRTNDAVTGNPSPLALGPTVEDSQDTPPLGVETTPPPEPSSSYYSGPIYFLNGDQDPLKLQAIQAGMEDRISFARRFSFSVVNCGTGCTSYWLVDRDNGAVVESPNEAPLGQTIWDIEAQRDSDIMRIIYGPQDGGQGLCTVQTFQWTGYEFDRRSLPEMTQCPN